MDADIEIFSLKDSVWKLNTRVLILENFIAQQFGTNALRQVHKKNSIVPATTSIPLSGTQNRSSPNKRRHSGSSTERQFSKHKTSSTNQNQPSRIKRIASTRVNYNEDECSTEEYYVETPNFENDVTLLTPKNEVTDAAVDESLIDLTDMNFMDIIEQQNNQNAVVKTVTTENFDGTKSTPQSKSMQACLSRKPSLINAPLMKTEKTLPQRKSRAKRSIVHLHYTEGEDGIFVCDHCGMPNLQPPTQGGITTMLRHLRSQHPDIFNQSQKTD